MHLFLWLSLTLSADAQAVSFERDIAPILATHCLECHGADAQESGLRLDRFSALTDGGDRGPAIVPGNSAASVLVKALEGQDDIKRMPLEADPLSADQIALVRKWIDQGGKGPAGSDGGRAKRRQSDHWSFQPIRRPALPVVKKTDWPRNAVDAFILARLEATGIAPSPEAERATLLRRLCLDLLGLPPTPQQLDEFLNDTRPNAYDRLVDRLLASPHYGERWGRHWLDAARYADSNGYTIDGPRVIWKYRDWVIDAFNGDMPFDRFTLEQMAGDLLPAATNQQVIATGFHRNTMFNEEGGTDDEQFRIERVVDRVNTTGAVFLGLTVECAQCHSHKFDPISQRDYYELLAFFNNSDEPVLSLPNPAEQVRLAELEPKVAAIEKQIKEHDAKQKDRLTQWEKELSTAAQAWEILEPRTAAAAADTTLTIQSDRSVLASGRNPSHETITLTIPVAKEIELGSLRLEALTDASLPKNGPGRAGNGNFVLSEFQLHVAVADSPDQWKPVALASALADHSQEKYPVAHAIDGNPKTGWAINTKTGGPNPTNVTRTAVFGLKTPARLQAGTVLRVSLIHSSVNGYNLGRLRISMSSKGARLATVSEQVAFILRIPPEKRMPEQQTLVLEQFQKDDPVRSELVARIDRLKKDLPSPITTLVLAPAKKPRQTHVHVRGDFLRKGALVSADVPDVLPPLEASSPTRIELARWLVSKENPLTARVAVNRVWQQFFGAGLVETENDFGSQGTPPTHPELLDWLAATWMDQGWSMKNLHRLIVTSTTYRQASNHRPELQTIDPQNRLLARQSRLRLEGEIVRDAALAVSGLWSGKIGGPSVFPYQPPGVMKLAQVDREWKVSTGGDQFRRTLYTYFWRSTPHPFLKMFDGPNAQVSCTRRGRSNTPLQSLTLLNDQSFVELARGLADRVLAIPAEPRPARFEHAFRLALGREPVSAELVRLEDYFDQQVKQFQSAEANATAFAGTTDKTLAAQRAGWTAVARVLLNVDEFITRE